MAERYQDRPFPADNEYDRGGAATAPKANADPLAELARLIGQTDPFTTYGRGNATAQPRTVDARRQPVGIVAEEEPSELPPPPSWMQNRGTAAAQHPLRPAVASGSLPAHPDQAYAQQYIDDVPLQAESNRYDDALYGQLEPAPGVADGAQYGSYPDQPYAYPEDYAEQPSENVKPRRTGMITVAGVLALAVVGTGGAFAYRTYMGSPRSGEVPVIRADAGPTKVIPPSADGGGKPIQDRLGAPNGTEALVSREEQPVDPTKSAPRVALPPLNATPNSPFPPVGSQQSKQPTPPNNGALTGDEPRRIRTLSVKPDQADLAASPVAKPAPAPRAPTPAPAAARPSVPAATANANASNAPLSLSPQPADPRTRVANAPPTETASVGGGGYVVQVSSQRSAADAQSSYKALQGKFPTVLGTRAPLIKRADLGDKGVFYRAMVGPFGTPDEATQFCGNLKSAGGQCVVQRN